MAMKKIPIAEQSLLCASIYVNNFKTVIEELIYNSLDAASSSIAIRVCIQEGFIQVLDNGSGILHENFSLLGQKYTTSKYVDINTLKSAPDKYGFRGLSLASIIDVSQSVKICSRYQNSPDTWLKIFYNGKDKDICKTISRPSKGTTVVIKGFLYNLNIQRKSVDPYNELHNIKIALQQLSLVHNNVSISLRDESKNDIIFQIYKNRNMYKTMLLLFQINENDFQELQVEKNEYKVKAFIGKTAVELNNYCHWIYLNGKFIQKSILHKKINDHLLKFYNTRNNNKTKNTYVFEENINDCNIPFYFIFISCPNYDFNMNYNSEKCLVEFKDWKEINKLIEKLALFYCGSAHLKSTKEEINKIENNEKISGTRTKIRGIIEKILNNKNKQPRISQLQNGVKGKILKRNRKKKTDVAIQKVLNSNTETINERHLKEFPQISNCLRKIDQTSLKEHSVNLKKLRNPLNMSNLTNKMMNFQVTSRKKSKKSVSTLKKKFHINNSIIKKFKEPTRSVKKRCKDLNHQIQKLIHKNLCKENTVYNVIKNNNNYQNITKNKEPYKQANKVTVQELIDIQSDIASSGNNNKRNYLNNQGVKKSYDLLKTVINSQYNNIENKKNLYEYKQKSTRTFTEKCVPMASYNSHNYNVEAAKRINYFISDNSHNNASSHKRDLLPFRSNFKNTKTPIFKLINKNNRYIPKNKFLSKFNQLQEFTTLYTIEMEDSNEIINFESGESHENMNNKVKSIQVNYTMSEVNNHTKFLHLNNTYTLEEFIRLPNNQLNKTYSLQMINMSHYYSEELQQPSIIKEIVDSKTNANGMEKRNIVIIESETDNTEIMSNCINPINVCEAVLHYSNELQGFENEFENSFVYKRNAVLLPNFNFIQNVNNHVEDVLHSNHYLSPNKLENNLNLNTSHFVTSKSIQNIEIHKKISQENLSLKIDNNTNDDCDKIHKFHLKSRHHFMPKGLSPITKNGCPRHASFSDDKVYYKDIIYTNFANDILVNSEIFGAEIQNVQSVFLQCFNIDKVNSEVQKQNADLIFDCQSLKQAKILGQVDRKFIATVLYGRLSQTDKYTNLLVLFDQHAVDERIRLENHLSDYVKDNRWKSVEVDPIPLELNMDDYLYFLNYKDKLTKFGLQWTFTTQNQILLNAIPKAILGKNPRQVGIVVKAVKKLILEQIKAIKSLKGNISMYPKSIMELVFSEACRYAIKFGDKLSKSDCAIMINSLAYCKTPFQCAHGRPVMAVITEITDNTHGYTVNLTKIKKFKKCFK